MYSLSSSADLKIREIKRDLVLQVYLGHGRFWEGVKRARAVQGVEVKVGVPPAHLLRPRLSRSYPKGHPKRPEGGLKELRAWVKRKRQSWDTSVRVAWELAVPTIYRDTANWDEFAAANILYDPPEPTPDDPNVLEEFAGYGSEESRAEALPIEWIDILGYRVDAMEEFYRSLLEELDKRHFKPYGASIWDAEFAIYNQTDLVEKLRTKVSEVPTSPVIVVNRHTNDKDVERAVRKIRATTGKNAGGKPPRDELLAIKMAALYRDHNYRLPEDSRRRRYTHESLVNEFGLDDAERVREVDIAQEGERRKAIGKEYLKLGDKLRNERKQNRSI